MPATMQYHAIPVRNGRGVGEAVTSIPDQTINYDGEETPVKVQP